LKGHRSVHARGSGCLKIQKFHPREWVDGSDPTYSSELLTLRIPPTEVGGLFRSNLFVQVKGLVRLNSLSNALGSFVSEAGSEQSTNCRWWDSRTRAVLAFRLDLNHPPTPVGGISEFLRASEAGCHSDENTRRLPQVVLDMNAH
jgi:hypothetical protein